jgi:hypothetical protein
MDPVLKSPRSPGADHVSPLSVGNLGVNSEFPIGFPSVSQREE